MVRSFAILSVIAALLIAGLAMGTCRAATGSPAVRVGSELDFPPYASVDENGRPIGFSVDLIKAVADAMGLSIEISTGPWDTVWNALVAGQLDVLPIVAKAPERQRQVDFSLPHTETYDAFFVRRGNPPIPDIDAARGKEIIVMRSDAAHHELLGRSFQGRLILVETIPAGLSLLLSGKHDAFLCSKLIGTLVIEKNGLRGLTAGPPISDYKRVFSFAVKKGDAELLEKLNQGLLIIKTNGKYERIYEKWLTADEPWRKLQKYLWPAVASIIAVALIVGVWLVMLQMLVKKRTRELAESNEMLRLAQEGLEERVAQRTAELAQANVALHTEISERQRAEEELKAANRELEAFSYSVSHDLRAPLRAISGFSGILTTEHTAGLDQEGLRLLQVIQENTQIMGRLIDGLLNLSRLGRQEVKAEDIDMQVLAQVQLQDLEKQNPGRKFIVTLKSLPPARGDRTLINQVWTNLLANAAKFTLLKEVAEIEVGGWTADHENIYYVKDNGVGFDPAYAGKLFGVFQRLHSSAKFEGTGVGLAIVQRIIQRHGGRVWAKGKIDAGATFYFSLPVTYPGKGD